MYRFSENIWPKCRLKSRSWQVWQLHRLRTWVTYPVAEWRGVVMQCGRLRSAVRTLHVGADRGARGRRGRIPCVTSCPPSAPGIPSARPRLHTGPCWLYLPLLLLRLFIYGQKLNKSVSAGSEWRFTELTPRTMAGSEPPIENKHWGIRSSR